MEKNGLCACRAHTGVWGGGGEKSYGVDDKHIRASEPSGTEDSDIMVEFLRLSHTTSQPSLLGGHFMRGGIS